MQLTIETGTPNAKIIPGSSSTVDVIWSPAGLPIGMFNLERACPGINNKILLNSGYDCYQRGVPGIADTIEGVAEWLKAKIRELDARYIRMIGISSGAIAAIIFGHLLRADTVIAVAPEIQLGVPGYRSFDVYVERQYHPQFRNLTGLIGQFGNRLNVVFPAWDVSDYRAIHAVLRAGTANVFFVPDMHSGHAQIDWKRLTSAPGTVDIGDIALRGLYDWRFDLENVWRGVAGFESIGRADAFADTMFASLLEVDPDNPGICYQASLQKVLLGKISDATELWRKAMRSMDATQILRVQKMHQGYGRVISIASYARLNQFIQTMIETEPPTRTRQAVNWLSAS